MQFDRRSTTLISLLLATTWWLAGCAAAGSTAATAEDTAPEEVPDLPDPAADEAPLEEAIVVVQPPGYCELLLENLAAARPLLENLDESLAGHSERMEAMLGEIAEASTAQAPLECPEPPPSTLGEKEVIGSIEWIYMNPPGAHFRARVDSGAETSSLSARDIEEFERDGDDWVRFTFEHEATEEPVQIEQPIVRTVVVRQPGVEETDRRAVVELEIRLGQRLQRTEFALTDRTQMTYPVLLGRAFIRDLYLIDVAQSYTHPRYQAP